MTTRVGLRVRLTALVAVVFGLTLSLLSIVVVRSVEHDLNSNITESTRNILVSYVQELIVGEAGVGVVDPNESTRFIYLDADGNEISEDEYYVALTESTDGSIIAGDSTTDDSMSITADDYVDISEFIVNDQLPSVLGDPYELDLGPGVVGVGQRVMTLSGDEYTVGVSSPVNLINESVDSLRRVLMIAVPLLIIAIAAITWFAVDRALSPVESLTRRAREITASRLDARLPVANPHDEIGRLSTTMNAMLERLDRSQQRQRQLTSDASHELRSPVAASISQLEVALASAPGQTTTDEWRTAAEIVLREQQQLAVLIDDLLALSRLDETSQLQRDPVDLDEIVVEECARPHAVPVRAVIDEPVRLNADPSLARRAIRNLIDNAARHATTRVTVTVRCTSRFGIIDVDDDGPGVPVAQRSRILERFARVDESRQRQRGGAGLGLAIAHDVAISHGGDLTVGDSPLGGARFTLRIARDDNLDTPAS